MSMHTELWFPNVIWSAILNSADNQELKNFAYDLQKIDKGVNISNYGGWQSSAISSGQNVAIDNLVSDLNSRIDFCCKQTGLPKLQLYNIWLNINPPNAYNHLHNHVGSVLSGVYYIDAEENQGNIQFERSDGAENFLPTPEKSTYFSCTRATYKSKTNALYIFPSWLKHNVEGNKSKNDRISISFNYGEKR
jgi:uncharacterized protein (TIGR02466 family)